MSGFFDKDCDLMTGVIEDKAAHYIVRLYSGDMTAGEEAALMNWLDADPRHKDEFDAQLAVSDAFVGEANQFHVPELDEWDGEERRLIKAPKYAFAIVAAMVLVAIISLIQANTGKSARHWEAHYETAVGEQKTVELPDGSTITLNTDTVLDVSFTKDERSATLEHGEAYFEIAKSKNRLFTVNAGSQAVTVLGTKFNIQKRGQEYTVAVLEGLVAIHPKGQLMNTPVTQVGGQTGAAELSGHQYRLKAGNVLTYKDTTDVVSTAIVEDTSKYSQWSSGIVTFDDATLADVVSELARYTPKKIMIVDKDIETIKVSGVFHLRELNEVVLGLEQAFPLQVIFHEDAILISGS